MIPEAISRLDLHRLVEYCYLDEPPVSGLQA